ncbi:hypothetical protein [Streptomyces sp. NBC_00158]|uniref:hypothetical protein n=1 Tax=Streptomyces sp. NBC_00158 TaxID=2903627 RepID=UPI002F90AE62
MANEVARKDVVVVSLDDDIDSGDYRSRAYREFLARHTLPARTKPEPPAKPDADELVDEEAYEARWQQFLRKKAYEAAGLKPVDEQRLRAILGVDGGVDGESDELWVKANEKGDERAAASLNAKARPDLGNLAREYALATVGIAPGGTLTVTVRAEGLVYYRGTGQRRYEEAEFGAGTEKAEVFRTSAEDAWKVESSTAPAGPVTGVVKAFHTNGVTGEPLSVREYPFRIEPATGRTTVTVERVFPAEAWEPVDGGSRIAFRWNKLALEVVEVACAADSRPVVAGLTIREEGLTGAERDSVRRVRTGERGDIVVTDPAPLDLAARWGRDTAEEAFGVARHLRGQAGSKAPRGTRTP